MVRVLVPEQHLKASKNQCWSLYGGQGLWKSRRQTNEVEKLVERMVKWLKVGGHIFFRESCFHQSGDSKRKVNPTHYREPRFYTKDDLKHPEEVEDI
ncbi:hypothetical protein ZWY2020_032595 [Hordeum vulgare]|nr:hypothetical protein ZWY2020_032595 [Hordeum vulgare]